MAEKTNHHALVVGASGLIGWSVVNQLLQSYPTPSPFFKVTALINRPLVLEDSFWPEQVFSHPQLSLTAGVNLLCSDEEFEETLKEKVSDVDSISHVYYFGK
jgi:nucleoside-diphosphate-sugar epimerase